MVVPGILHMDCVRTRVRTLGDFVTPGLPAVRAVLHSGITFRQPSGSGDKRLPFTRVYQSVYGAGLLCIAELHILRAGLGNIHANGVADEIRVVGVAHIFHINRVVARQCPGGDIVAPVLAIGTVLHLGIPVGQFGRRGDKRLLFARVYQSVYCAGLLCVCQTVLVSAGRGNRYGNLIARKVRVVGVAHIFHMDGVFARVRPRRDGIRPGFAVRAVLHSGITFRQLSGSGDKRLPFTRVYQSVYGAGFLCIANLYILRAGLGNIHANGVADEIRVVGVAHIFHINRVVACQCPGGEAVAPIIPVRAVLHLGISAGQFGRCGDKRLGLAGIDQVFVSLGLLAFRQSAGRAGFGNCQQDVQLSRFPRYRVLC